MTSLVFHPIYSQLNLPDKHRFPVQKYQGIRNALADAGVNDGLFQQPRAVAVSQLKRVFSPCYIEDDLRHNNLDSKAMRRIGFPWSEQLITRTLTAVGGTLLTSQTGLRGGQSLKPKRRLSPCLC